MNLRRLFARRSSRDRWWLISRHRVLGVDAFIWGPFRTEERARAYPGTFRGWVDSIAMLPSRYDLRVVSAPKGTRPAMRTTVAEPKPMGPLDIYLSTGHIPTGRTAEILHFAQELYDRSGDDVGR
jgi:hypothetical protein